MKKIIGLIIIVGAIYWLPNVNWGKVRWLPSETVTVSGEARQTQKNQIASFSAGVMATGMDKDKAITEVNTKINELINSVKDFGIEAKDIKTQNLSYYQEQKGGLNPGQWQVNNTIEITLRNIDKASELANLLARSGANNVYGPNFQFDDTSEFENSLMAEAIKNAKTKAETIATASGRKLGKVVTVTEGGGTSNIYPMYAMKGADAGGGAPVEPGSGTISKSVTVVFELK